MRAHLTPLSPFFLEIAIPETAPEARSAKSEAIFILPSGFLSIERIKANSMDKTRSVVIENTCRKRADLIGEV